MTFDSDRTYLSTTELQFLNKQLEIRDRRRSDAVQRDDDKRG
jgi:hypothetical protein